MRLIKYPAVLTFLLFAVVSNSNAQASVKFLGGGTPALFQELGAASQSIPGISCIWTSLPTSNINISAADLRWFAPLSPLYDQGSIFVAWGPGTGTCANPTGTFDVYSYMELDSVVAMKCYFMVNYVPPAAPSPGCSQMFSVPAGTAGANLMKLTSGTDTPIPATVINAISNQNFFVAGTDLRPEDAKFAIDRMLRPVLNAPMGPGGCGQLLPRQVFNQDSYFTFGMGYNYLHSFSYEPHYGGPIVRGVAELGGGTVSVADFEIVGPDPVSGKTVPSSTVSTIGAKPILVGVSPNTDTTGIGAASDINGFTLALFYQGVLARASDLVGPTAANPVNVFVPDPLAGDYNVFEYSVPNGTQYHSSQDYQNCFPQYGLALTDPLNLQSANGNVNAYRQRVIGDNMVTYLNAATTDTIGYFYWSPITAASLKNVKYLKVNGIDPIQDAYTNGTLPGSGGPGDPGLAAVTFSGLNSGNYPIWSVLRLVSQNPTPAGVTNMLTALNNANFQHDYVNPANLKVWHSHFVLNLSSINSSDGSIVGFVTAGANGPTLNPATPGDLCNPSVGAAPEVGGDAGGSILSKQANADFCRDFNNQSGLINKTQ